MVRQGLLAFLVIGLVACTQDVDDPATFTAGNTAGASTTGEVSAQTSSTTDPGNTSVDDNGNGMTSTTGDAADSSGGGGMNTSTGGGGNGNCGNGAIDAGEQCDGMDLQGFDCAALGLSGGTLACDPMMCTFDTSMCNAGPGTSG